MLVFDSFENDLMLTHRAANKSELARKGRRRALTHNPQLLAFVLSTINVTFLLIIECQRFMMNGHEKNAESSDASSLLTASRFTDRARTEIAPHSMRSPTIERMLSCNIKH